MSRAAELLVGLPFLLGACRSPEAPPPPPVEPEPAREEEPAPAPAPSASPELEARPADASAEQPDAHATLAEVQELLARIERSELDAAQLERLRVAEDLGTRAALALEECRADEAALLAEKALTIARDLAPAAAEEP